MLTDRQTETDKQTKNDDYISSLAEVIKTYTVLTAAFQINLYQLPLIFFLYLF